MRLAKALAAVLAAGLALSACGDSGGSAASASDPIGVVTGYMQAVADGNASGGQAFLQSDINDGIPLAGPTPASRYISEHKGARWQIIAVPWADAHNNPVSTKNACTVTPPQGGQLCIVTVEVDTGASKVWFHFDVENRYPVGKWEIVGVTRVDTKPDDLLPNGNEAHAG